MTNKNKQALELYDRMMDFIENVVARHSGSWHINDFGSKKELETIRAALQPKPSVDVDALKEKIFKDIKEDYGQEVALKYAPMMYVVISRLAEQGHLNPGWRDMAYPPTPNERVLVLSYGKVFIVTAKQEDIGYIRYIPDEFDGRWVGDICEKSITHWMPLPQAPKSEGE